MKESRLMLIQYATAVAAVAITRYQPAERHY